MCRDKRIDSTPYRRPLFTDDCQREGIPQTAEWRAIDPMQRLYAADPMRLCWRALAAMSATRQRPNAP